MASNAFHMIWLQGEEHMKEQYRTLFDDMQVTKQMVQSVGATFKLWTEQDASQNILRVESKIGVEKGSLWKHYDQAPSFAAKADLLRIVVVFLHGGTYMDADCFLAKPDFTWITSDAGHELDMVVSWFQFNSFVEKQIVKENISSHFWWARKGSTILRSLLLAASRTPPFKAKGNPYGTEFEHTLELLGPNAFDKHVKAFMARHSDNVRVVPSLITEPFHSSQYTTGISYLEDRKDIIRKMRKRNPYAVVVHRGSATWFEGKHGLETWLDIWRTTRICAVDILVALLVGCIAFILYKSFTRQINKKSGFCFKVSTPPFASPLFCGCPAFSSIKSDVN